MDERKNSGRFQKGKSGNPRGRPTKRQTTHKTTAGYRATMLEVGATPVQIVDKATGETQEISLLRANMRALGLRGASGHTPSAKALIEKHAEAARINGELTELTHFLFRETAKLELMVDRLQALVPNANGGAIHVEVKEEDWMRLVGIKEENWRNRKISVEPQLP